MVAQAGRNASGVRSLPDRRGVDRSGVKPSDPDAFGITDQELIFAGPGREHGDAIVEPRVQVSPFPVAQSLRGCLQMPGGIVNVVARNRSSRGRDPGAVALVGGGTLPFVSPTAERSSRGVMQGKENETTVPTRSATKMPETPATSPLFRRANLRS